jgi:hypothetical protein
VGYEFRNKVTVRSKQNLIDIAIQEYGRADALFTLIDLNPNREFTIDSVLDDLVTEKIFADNQTDQDIELVKKFDLEGRNVVNEDFDSIAVEDEEPAFTPIFDTIGVVPPHSFSLFLMTSTYSGPAIRIRVTATGLEYDIGFVDGYVDKDDIVAKLNGGGGAIAKWYNQGTNGAASDLFNASATEQPRIQIGTFAGHAALYCGGFVSHNLHSSVIGGIDQNTMDMYVVGYKSSTAWTCPATATLLLTSYGASYTAVVISSTSVRSYVGGVHASRTVSSAARAWCSRTWREGATLPVRNAFMLDGEGSPTVSQAVNTATEGDVNYLMMGAERESAIASPYVGDILELTHFDGVFLSTENAALYDAWRAEKYAL